MTSSKPRPTQETTLFDDIASALRYYLGGRRGVLLGTAAAVILGLVFNWQWLVALGVAPLLLSILPCALMCGLGLCMHKLGKGNNSCGSNADSMPADKSSAPGGKPDDAA